MVFSSLEYGLFLVAMFFVTWLIGRKLLLRNVVLGLASLYFYMCWSPKYVLLMLFCIATNYVAGLGIQATFARGGSAAGEEGTGARRRKLWMAAAVVSNLALLFAYKYLGLATSTLQQLADFAGLAIDVPKWSLVLPVGISFFTFQAMSYSIDVYYRRVEATRSFWEFLLYVAFFPQLVAGPIVRAGDFIHQLKEPRTLSADEASDAIYRILLGLVKKVAISDWVAVNLVDRVFQAPQMYSSVEVLFGVYGYAVQIYCDFSAYSDIAIGSARLLGFWIPENFNLPYLSVDIQDFWRRWHISLSTWLKDNLYVPLGGNRGKRPWLTYRNLMLTMLLGGLWHGAAWTFVAWGGLHGAGLAWARYRERKRLSLGLPVHPTGWRRAVSIFVTFHVVCALWVLFRAHTFGGAMDVFAAIAACTTETANLDWTVLVAMAAGLSGHALPGQLAEWTRGGLRLLPAVIKAGVIVGVVYLLSLAASADVIPFIYFQF
jgi:D-alanyl-lipoteichoic acid acyltransferase DltB (MBOAT superfamily)